MRAKHCTLNRSAFEIRPNYFCKLNRASKFRLWFSRCRGGSSTSVGPPLSNSCNLFRAAVTGAGHALSDKPRPFSISRLRRASRRHLLPSAIRTRDGRAFSCAVHDDQRPGAKQSSGRGKGEIANRRCGGQRLKLLCKLRRSGR